MESYVPEYSWGHVDGDQNVQRWGGTFWRLTPPQPLKASPGHSERDLEHLTLWEGRRGHQRGPIIPFLLNRMVTVPQGT